MTLSFIEYAENQLRLAPPTRKSLHTKELLKVATARVLDKRGYHALRVPEIAAKAGVSEAAFYTYFADKREAVVAVLGEALQYLSGLRRTMPGRSVSRFDAFRRINLFWLQAERANAGLVHCAFQFAETDPEFAHLWRRNSREMYQWAVNRIAGRYPEGAIDPSLVLLVVYGLASMHDEYTRLMLSGDDPVFLQLLREHAPDDESLAELMSVIWHRALYPGLPIEDVLRPAAAALWTLEARLAPPMPTQRRSRARR
jgi:AcrR family transcriptional regulator